MRKAMALREILITSFCLAVFVGAGLKADGMPKENGRGVAPQKASLQPEALLGMDEGAVVQAATPSVTPGSKGGRPLDVENERLLKQERELLDRLSSYTASVNPTSLNESPDAARQPVKGVEAADSYVVEAGEATALDAAMKRRVELLTKWRKENIGPRQVAIESEVTKNLAKVWEGEGQRSAATEKSRLLKAAYKESKANDSDEGVQVAYKLVIEGAPQLSDLEPNMPLAMVLSSRTPLRTGPGKNNSWVSLLERGDEVAVERVRGDWMRVVTPTRVKGWVATEALLRSAL